MTYTHRNGEAESPTVPGQYWFRGYRENDAKRFDEQKIVLVDKFLDEIRIDPHEYWTCQEPKKWAGEWWGPIVPPWEVAE